MYRWCQYLFQNSQFIKENITKKKLKRRIMLQKIYIINHSSRKILILRDCRNNPDYYLFRIFWCYPTINLPLRPSIDGNLVLHTTHQFFEIGHLPYIGGVISSNKKTPHPNVFFNCINRLPILWSFLILSLGLPTTAATRSMPFFVLCLSFPPPYAITSCKICISWTQTHILPSNPSRVPNRPSLCVWRVKSSVVRVPSWVIEGSVSTNDEEYPFLYSITLSLDTRRLSYKSVTSFDRRFVVKSLCRRLGGRPASSSSPEDSNMSRFRIFLRG